MIYIVNKHCINVYKKEDSIEQIWFISFDNNKSKNIKFSHTIINLSIFLTKTKSFFISFSLCHVNICFLSFENVEYSFGLHNILYFLCDNVNDKILFLSLYFYGSLKFRFYFIRIFLFIAFKFKFCLLGLHSLLK